MNTRQSRFIQLRAIEANCEWLIAVSDKSYNKAVYSFRSKHEPTFERHE